MLLSRVNEPTRAGVGFRSERGPILIALMLTTGLVAIDATILATAVPSIVSDLGGFAQFPWLFSIYLLAQAVSVPVYAKLSDTLGRKPIVLVGIGLFLLGSILCGFAWSMPALIAFRAIQGLGAGAIQPMSMTIAGDIYTVAERAKTQGYLASVWAISSVVGPTLGGVFSQFLSWRWIFFVNIPLCILAAWMLIRAFHETIERRRHRIDYAGAALLTGGMTLLILAVLEGGQAWAWDSVWSIGSFAVGGVLLVAFVLVERKAAEPVLPLWVFSRRLLVTTTLISLGVGAIGYPVGAIVMAILADKLDRRLLILGSTCVWLIGMLLLGSLAGDTIVTIGSFLASFALGLYLQVAYTYTAELFPTRARASGFSLSDGIGHSGGVVGALLLPVVVTAGGFFLGFAGIGITGLIAGLIALFGPKTSGRRLESVSK